MCVIGVCFSAAINNIQPEPESKIPDNAVEEVKDNETSDLDTAELVYFGLGGRGYGGGYRGGYGGYGGGRRGCGCGYGGSHYHGRRRYYGKK